MLRRGIGRRGVYSVRLASWKSGDISGMEPPPAAFEGRRCSESRRWANSDRGDAPPAAAFKSASISGVFIGVEGAMAAGVRVLLME
eukprot:scaffold50749_cov25-Tisochrysis_lutea.AAC.2